MDKIEWINLVIIVYLIISYIRKISGMRALPFSSHLFVLTLLKAVVVPLISYFIDLFTYSTLRSLRIYIYNTFFYWETIIFIVISWGTLVFITDKSPRIRILFEKHQIILKVAGYLLAMIFFYIKYTIEPMAYIGFCELPEPSEYLRLFQLEVSTSSLQSSHIINTTSTSWPISVELIVSISLFIASCNLNYILHNQIKIA